MTSLFGFLGAKLLKEMLALINLKFNHTWNKEQKKIKDLRLMTYLISINSISSQVLILHRQQQVAVNLSPTLKVQLGVQDLIL